ncbi:FAD-dependent monooxygenase [Nocardia sp. NPDC051750]|uniref:FAD-dependent monooxygenase n=1 Tax=Nocardia sp. NPDC051750 TaxID=3364325 RepID=UPI00378B76C2
MLIAGAGPAGLTLAIDLARRNIAVRLIDRATEFAAGSRGDGIQPPYARGVRRSRRPGRGPLRRGTTRCDQGLYQRAVGR